MATLIFDSVTGKGPRISSRNELLVTGATLSPGALMAIADSGTFTMDIDAIAVAGVNDVFAYILNSTGSTVRDVMILAVSFTASGATNIRLGPVSGTAAGGTAVVPANRTVGSTVAIAGTYETGTDITGLTFASSLERLQLGTDTELERDLSSRPIIIQPAQALALDSTAAVTISGTLTLASRTVLDNANALLA